MQKTPEEIKKGLRLCGSAWKKQSCHECPYAKKDCRFKLHDDTLAYILQLEEAKQGWYTVEEGYPVNGSDIYMVIHMPEHVDEDGVRRKAESKVYSGNFQRTKVPELNIDNRFWTFNDGGDEFVIKNEHRKSEYEGGFEEYVTHWMYHVKPDLPKGVSND